MAMEEAQARLMEVAPPCCPLTKVAPPCCSKLLKREAEVHFRLCRPQGQMLQDRQVNPSDKFQGVMSDNFQGVMEIQQEMR